MATIAVIDYHKGNLSSVARGLARAGAEALVTDDPEQIRAADGAVIPGVGSFYDAIAFMHESGQDAAVLDAIAAGKPFLGICLGTQLLFDCGDEGVPNDAAAVAAATDACGTGLEPGAVFTREDGSRWVRGLGVLRGSCTVLPGRRLKVPHVGWGPAARDRRRPHLPAACRCGRGRQRVLQRTRLRSMTMRIRQTLPPARTTGEASRASSPTVVSSAVSSIPRNPRRMGTRFSKTSCASWTRTPRRCAHDRFSRYRPHRRQGRAPGARRPFPHEGVFRRPRRPGARVCGAGCYVAACGGPVRRA